MSYKSINKTLKYSIRKLAVGATPVVIGTFLLAGGTTALASEGSGSNVSINYVADSELTDYEKSLVKQGIPEELKNGETYYLVYKNESYLQKNKLPDTGSTSLPLKGIGFATALLTVVLVSKKNRNKILGIVLIGALGQSVVLPSSTFALENKLLAGYNHMVSANSKFEDNLISIDGYKYVGYLTSDDVSLNSVNTQEYHIQKSIVKTRSTDNKSDEGRVTTKPKEKDIENKPQVKENLTDVVKNSDDNIPLPVVVEEVLSETTKEEEIEVSDNENNNSSVEKDTSIEKKTNSKAPVANNATLENEKEKSQTNVNAPIEKSNLDKSNIKEKTNIKPSKSSEENTTIKNNTVETPKNIQDTTKSQKDTATDTSNKDDSSLTTDGVKPTKVKKKVKVVERIIKVTETIPYKVVYEEDENMENGTTKVIKEGTVGEKTTIQKVLLNNGEELKREITSSTVKQKEVDKVIKVGTKGVKKHNSKPEINNDSQSAQKTKLIPKKETVYTEIVESKQRKYVKDYPKLEEATKDIKNNIGLLTTQKDKLSTINITNIFDDSLFEGERRFENVMMYYVQANLKRKREFENQEEVIDNIISKEIPVITGVMRIGTRKPGFETLKGDGKLVNISSDLDKNEIKNIKLSNNNSHMLDKEVPGYLGSAININYDKDFKNTKLGLKFDVENIKADSQPTMYNYDSKTQLLEELKTEIIGDMAYANVEKPGSLLVLDKQEYDKVDRKREKYEPNETSNSPGTKNPVGKIVGRSIVFAIDSSGSMLDNDENGLRKSLTKELIGQLYFSDDKLSIVDFDSRVQVSTELTKDFKSVEKVIDNIDSAGGTYIPAALKEGINKLIEDNQSENRKYIFVLTDGEDSSDPGNDYDIVINEARKNNIAIYTIGLKNANQELLKRVANATGGKFYFAEEASNLPRIYEQINDDIIFKSTDYNEDKISAEYTRKILKGELLLGTGKESPYFKKQIEIARNDISKKYNININDKEAINKKINDLSREEIESYLIKDYDKDNLLNGEEVRPEINKKGDSYLYVLSDPENPDTDGDGIGDDKDKSTDFDNYNGSKLNLTSNTDDTDGDGYDDAFELNRGEVDSFGERHLPDRWNVGYRDLLLFSHIVYYNFSDDIFSNDISKKLNETNYRNMEGIFNSKELEYLNLQAKENYDGEFFDRWKLVHMDKLPYSHNLSSIAMLFENDDNYIIAFRGTDEGGPELLADAGLLYNVNPTSELAIQHTKTMIDKILENDKRKYQDSEKMGKYKIYVTGHSLGGYEAYIGFLEAKNNNKVKDKVKSVINFNGPGLNIYRSNVSDKTYEDEYNKLLEIYKKNENSVQLFKTATGLVNKAIVHGFSKFKHFKETEVEVKYINPEKVSNEYKNEVLDEMSEKIDDVKYPHSLISFYGELDQKLRSSRHMFTSANEILYQRELKKFIERYNKYQSVKNHVYKVVKETKDSISEGIKNFSDKIVDRFKKISKRE